MFCFYLGKPRLKWYAPDGWTRMVSDLLEKNLKITCCLSFKCCNVFGTQSKELKTIGICKECQGTISLISKNGIKSFEVEIKKLDESLHTYNNKRRLDKVSIKALQVKLSQNKPFNVRNQLNLDNSLPTESRSVPHLQSLYQITHNQRKREQFADNVYESLLKMKFSEQYTNSIHDIGLSPFYVMYWTEKQKVRTFIIKSSISFTSFKFFKNKYIYQF